MARRPKDEHAYDMDTHSTAPKNANARNAERIEAEVKAGGWLHLGNLAAERGDHAKAERHYERSQRWLDKMNQLLGNG